MIRNNSKIFGEMNDPNTVIATGILQDSYPVVGAGNKGVKTIDLGAKRILVTDANGKLAGFNFNTANKVVGTDSSGNLILKDMPNPTPAYFRASSVSSSNGYLTVGATTQFGSNCSKTALTTGSMFYSTRLTATLASPIVISAAGNKTVTLQVAILGTTSNTAANVGQVLLCTADETKYVQFNDYSGPSSSYYGAVAFAGTKMVEAGTYTKLIIDTGLMPSSGSPSSTLGLNLVISGMIIK